MLRIAYWSCFALVFISILFGRSVWLLHLMGHRIPESLLMWTGLFSFGSLIPRMLNSFVPRLLGMVIGYLMLFFVLRRIWLLFSKKEWLPSSFYSSSKIINYSAKVISYIGFFLIAAAISAWTVTIALKAGSGVPAAMITQPATIFVPWSFFLIEIFSVCSLRQREF